MEKSNGPCWVLVWNNYKLKCDILQLTTDGLYNVLWHGSNRTEAEHVAREINQVARELNQGVEPSTYELDIVNPVKEPVQYISIVEDDPKILTKKVNEKLKDGWSLRGHTIPTVRNSLVHYLQVMIKE